MNWCVMMIRGETYFRYRLRLCSCLQRRVELSAKTMFMVTYNMHFYEGAISTGRDAYTSTYIKLLPDHWEKNAIARIIRIRLRFPGVVTKDFQLTFFDT